MKSNTVSEKEKFIAESDEGNKVGQVEAYDRIDLFEFCGDLLKYWKSIIVVTFVAALLSVAFALSIPKVYRAIAVTSLPAKSTVAAINTDGLEQYTDKTLFKAYFDKVRSHEFLRHFVIQHGYLERLYPEAYKDGSNEVVNNQSFAKLIGDFKVTILEPVVNKNVFNDQPTQIRISIEHGNESLIVGLINHYIDFASQSVMSDISTQQQNQRDVKLVDLTRTVALLRKNALMSRQLSISKMIEENNEKIALLEQQKAILIEKAAADRQTQIAILEESNQRRLKELQQQRDLLIWKDEKDRETSIAIAKEARKIAKSLNITRPTQLDALSRDVSNASGEKTQINLSSEQSLPLYLMGTEYIDAYIETLQERNNKTTFLKELNEIDREIAKVKDDQALKILKLRDTDEKYLVEINQIDASIKKIESDLKLAALQSRKSDDPFISELPELLNEIERLDMLSLDYGELSPYRLSVGAFASNRAIKPNRPLIAIVGTLFGGTLALMFAFISVVRDKRSK